MMTQAQKTPAQTEKLNLSATQVIASGLAAVSSTVAASYFGVAGTVIGAAFGAILTVVGNAVYGYSLRRTRNRVLDLAVAQRFGSTRTMAGATAGDSGASGSARARPARTPIQWHPKRLGLAVAGMFLVIMAATTAFEFASGQPLSSTVTGNHGSGTSLGGRESKPSAPAPSPTRSLSPSTSVTPSVASPTASDSATPSDSTSAPTSSSPSDPGSPSASPSTSGSPATSPTPSG